LPRVFYGFHVWLVNPIIHNILKPRDASASKTEPSFMHVPCGGFSYDGDGVTVVGSGCDLDTVCSLEIIVNYRELS
jgi:hypothetical protein